MIIQILICLSKCWLYDLHLGLPANGWHPAAGNGNRCQCCTQCNVTSEENLDDVSSLKEQLGTLWVLPCDITSGFLGSDVKLHVMLVIVFLPPLGGAVVGRVRCW